MRRPASVLISVATAALVAGIPAAASAAGTWALDAVPLPAGANGGWLTAVSCPASSDCAAVGEVGVTPNVERWDGATWSVQALPLPPGQNNGTLQAISCPSVTACIAVGYYVTGEGEALPMAEEWNGANWMAQLIPAPPGGSAGPLSGVSCSSADACTAIGRQLTGGPDGTRPVVERWNGRIWMAQVTGPRRVRGGFLPVRGRLHGGRRRR